ncbi:hypothetical protein HPTD01_1808 [Halomonas sp. TD01]|nr:hypothetical protein HPTD01_1808 [Halomonas sp. TD01]
MFPGTLAVGVISVHYLKAGKCSEHGLRLRKVNTARLHR